MFTYADGRPIRPEYLTHRFRQLTGQLGLPPIRLHDYADICLMPMSGRSAWSAVVSGPVVRAATRETAVTLRFAPSGWARVMACSLGALAGRKALLLPCETLDSDGSALGIITAAAIQTMTTSHLNLTANRAIARNMSSTRTCTEYRQERALRRTRTRPRETASQLFLR